MKAITTMTTFDTALRAGLVAAILSVSASTAFAAGGGPTIERNKWNFGGFFGQFDKAQLRRGFQVYQDACVSCHGLKRVYSADIVQPGGPEFPEDSVKALAASWPNQIHDGPNDDGNIADRKGNPIKRPAKLADPILGPYDNDNQARAAQNGAVPPDLSLMARARNVEYTGSIAAHPLSMLRDVAVGYQEGGADYIYAILTGYAEKPPAYVRDKGHLKPVADTDVKDEKAVERCASVAPGDEGQPDVCNALQDGMHFNKYFAGGQIAMPPPLANPVKYGKDAGVEATVEQNARDLAAFLSFTADPKLSDRKKMGWQVMLYLLVTSILLYIAKKRIWKSVH